jgi:hypothetical protein
VSIHDKEADANAREMCMSYTDETVLEVWERAMSVENNDSSIWRKDECGAWIQRTMYGDRHSQYGWEIDHLQAQGPDHVSNLRPLHWKNSTGTGDGRLICRVTSSGVDNKGMT